MPWDHLNDRHDEYPDSSGEGRDQSGSNHNGSGHLPDRHEEVASLLQGNLSKMLQPFQPPNRCRVSTHLDRLSPRITVDRETYVVERDAALMAHILIEARGHRLSGPDLESLTCGSLKRPSRTLKDLLETFPEFRPLFGSDRNGFRLLPAAMAPPSPDGGSLKPG